MDSKQLMFTKSEKTIKMFFCYDIGKRSKAYTITQQA